MHVVEKPCKTPSMTEEGGSSSHSEGAVSSPPTRRAGAVKRTLRPIMATVALIFVLFAGWDLWERWDGSGVKFHFAPLWGALLFASLAMWFQLCAWRSLIRSWTKKKMHGALSAKLYLDSQMARYTPGKVGLAVVRISGAESVGVAPRVMTTALLVELVSWCGVGTLIGGLVIGIYGSGTEVGRAFPIASALLAACSALGLVVLMTVDRARLPTKVRESFGEGKGPIIPLAMPGWHLAHFVSWTICGALVGLSVQASLSDAIVIGGLLCVAIVGGFVALLAPAGAGVREAVMALGAAPLVGPAASVAVGILSRVVSLLSDVLLFFFFRLRARGHTSGR